MNDETQMLLAPLLKLYSHVSRIRFYGLRHCFIKNGVDDAGSFACERMMILLGKPVNARTQNAVFSDDFGNIKPISPPLHAVLRRTRDEIVVLRSIGYQALA
jgi:hypothetical protein